MTQYALETNAIGILDPYHRLGRTSEPWVSYPGLYGLAGVDLTTGLLAGGFFAAGFLAGAFLAGAFLAGAFLAGAFFFAAAFGPPPNIVMSARATGAEGSADDTTALNLTGGRATFTKDDDSEPTTACILMSESRESDTAVGACNCTWEPRAIISSVHGADKILE